MVALEDRFFRWPDGQIYSNTVCDYVFWSRYLQLFDEVIVFARVGQIQGKKPSKVPANGPGVHFFPLPYYVGPWQYLGKHRRLVALSKRATWEADAFILRIPGMMSTLLWRQLMRREIPYGVEVIGSSTDSAKTCGANILLRAIGRLMRRQKDQCQYASAAAYVTKSYLQSNYPTGAWSMSCSDICLSDEAIVDDSQFNKRFVSLKDAISGKRAFCLCNAGTMAALYKAQDVLISAVSICLNAGFNIQLTLLGDGKYRQYFARKAEALGVAQSVSFLGWLPPGQPVRGQLDGADMFVLPSLIEGLPRALIEAMARGLPCIATDVGGIPELLATEDLVPPNDAKALASKIELVIGHEERLERMARRNLERAKEYHIEELGPRRVKFYKKVADETKAWSAKRNKSESS
jgi:glycosyltransferase involved in cell wall biosynthesis